MEWIKLLTDFLPALANFFWPLIAIYAIHSFSPEIKPLLSRLKKGKFLGLEFELDKLNETVQKAEEETLKSAKEGNLLEFIPEKTTLNQEFNQSSYSLNGEQEKSIDGVIELSASEPIAALLKLYQAIEKELRIIAISTVLIRPDRRSSVRQLTRILSEKNILLPHTAESLEQFSEIRNKVVHGSDLVSRSSIFSLIDTGLQLLKTLRSIPVEVITVYESNIPIYKDANCSDEYEEIRGLILHYKSPGQEMTKIWPVRKNTNFKKGDYVTKDWDTNIVWEHTWYIDPDTHEKKLAWTGACEFIGVAISGV
jgi:uncharacterized protein YutE (UPF0331/DUF86 family)